MFGDLDCMTYKRVAQVCQHHLSFLFCMVMANRRSVCSFSHLCAKLTDVHSTELRSDCKIMTGSDEEKALVVVVALRCSFPGFHRQSIYTACFIVR